MNDGIKQIWVAHTKLNSLILVLLLCSHSVFAQPVLQDSVFTLSAITVKAFETNRQLLETPASINIIQQKNLQRFAGISLVPALNIMPGVRMEERSPGSYRLSIRGSLLRSPFGVRNIKVYVDNMPFTDAGGNTYINLIEPSIISSAEILKGPAASLYGAGTGGTVVFNTANLKHTSQDDTVQNKMNLQLQGGSYGMVAENIRWQRNTKDYGLQLSQSHLQCDGYRANSRMRKDVIHFAGNRQINSANELKFQLLFANLFYQTPGALTLSQWQTDPRQARPATVILPGAKDQQAAVYNKTVFSGLNNTWNISKKWSNVSSIVFNYTDFKNPFITNFEKRKEVSRGLRTKMLYKAIDNASVSLNLIGGAEWQTTFASIGNYGNKAGVADTVQSKDEVNAFQRFYFSQVDIAVEKKLFVTAGASINQFTYRYKRLTDDPAVKKIKAFDIMLSPRLAVSYLVTDKIAVRAIVSKGFSAPTIAEVRPSEGSLYENLQAEYGWNYETGIRGTLFNNHLQFDINAYTFNLKNAIVRRTTNSGTEYFMNAGGTKQQGVEGMIGYILKMKKRSFVSSLKISSSVTLNKYRFREYKINTVDYSGNKLTGVPGEVIVNTIDFEFKNNLQLYITYNYTSQLPITDDNMFWANEYHLLQCKLVYRIKVRNVAAEIFTGADNLLNQQYSLGNDLNAAGNRFYNAAPLRNYFAGVSVGF